MSDPMVVSLRSPKRVEEPAPPPPRPPERREPERTSRRGRRFPWMFIVVVLTVLAFGVGGYYYFFMKENVATSGAPSSAGKTQEQLDAEVKAEITDVVGKVGKLIVLPQGEEPTVATVTDPEKLAGQTFFENAKVGHKVLIYTKARKAYLYDPEKNMLVEVAPITAEIR